MYSKNYWRADTSIVSNLGINTTLSRKLSWSNPDKKIAQTYHDQFQMEEYLSQILEFCVTCGVNMMSLRHGWVLGSPQTASPIHNRHIQIVWAHWYAFHWHTVAALNSYTHPTCLRFWGFGSLVESKLCHYAMVEAEGHLKLLSPSTLDIQSVWTHRYAFNQHTAAALHRYPSYLSQILGLGFTCGVKMMSLHHGWGWQPPGTSSPIYIRHIHSVWAHWLVLE